jgi:cytochrome c peroxidase
MKKLSVLVVMATVSFLLIVACSKEKNVGDMKLNVLEPVLPDQPYDYANIQTPAYIQQEWRPIDNKKAALGRVLFYDKMLSINNSIACASCHIQQLAFSDGKKFSGGVTSTKTPRNSLAIMNAGRENGYFWDLRENDLQTMVLKPIQNHIEMGFDKMEYVVANIQQTPYYKPLFADAFGTTTVTAENIGEALMQFLVSMKSHTSKYDIGRQSNFSNFSAQELLGMELMTQKLYCKNCHMEPDFKSTWQTAANIGLDLDYNDGGVGDLQPLLGDRLPNNSPNGNDGVFKIPSLRNIELTAPYMHDGRFKTLEEVVEHYNSGVQNHPNLDWNLKFAFDEKTGQQTGSNDTPLRLNLNAGEKAALVAFLKTLTDYNYTNNVIYSNPFKVKELN